MNIRDRVEERLQAMYLSGLSVDNLDTGKVDPPMPLEEALSYHLPKVISLIEETCNEAREDELEKAVQQFILNTKSNPHNFSEYAHARLKQLMGGK